MSGLSLWVVSVLGLVTRGAAVALASGFARDCHVPPTLEVIQVKDPRGGRFQMAVRADTDYVSNWLRKYGYWEITSPQGMADLARSRMMKNGTFLDVGANLGWYTMLFAMSGFQVVAVEPVQLNRQALNLTLCLNPDIRDRVRVVSVALVAPEMKSNRCAIGPHDPTNRGDAFLNCTTDGTTPSCGDGGLACEEVPVRTLDEVLDELRTPVDVVKMDIEGSECNVLRGSNKLLSNLQPKFVQVETLFSWVRDCFHATMKQYSYLVGPGIGHDKNRVAVPDNDENRVAVSGQPGAGRPRAHRKRGARR